MCVSCMDRLSSIGVSFAAGMIPQMRNSLSTLVTLLLAVLIVFMSGICLGKALYGIIHGTSPALDFTVLIVISAVVLFVSSATFFGRAR